MLAALQVALNFKPYAEFMDKYGDDPQNIKDAIREEIKAELLTPAEDKTQPKDDLLVSPFSASQRRASVDNKVGVKKSSLEELFNK